MHEEPALSSFCIALPVVLLGLVTEMRRYRSCCWVDTLLRHSSTLLVSEPVWVICFVVEGYVHYIWTGFKMLVMLAILDFQRAEQTNFISAHLC